jgi:hypothetical protein
MGSRLLPNCRLIDRHPFDTTVAGREPSPALVGPAEVSRASYRTLTSTFGRKRSGAGLTQ